MCVNHTGLLGADVSQPEASSSQDVWQWLQWLELDVLPREPGGFCKADISHTKGFPEPVRGGLAEPVLGRRASRTP